MRDGDDYVWPAAAVVGAATVGALAYFGPSAVRQLAARIIPAPPLSSRRELVLRAVAEVVPSQYPDERWRRLAPSYRPDDPDWAERIRAAGADPARYSTCGELPGHVADVIGAKGGLERRGLASVMTAGKANGAWVEAGAGRRPRPGDFLVIGDRAGSISHVSIAIDTEGSTWRTADAGQGPRDRQAAAYVERSWNERAGTLGAPQGSTAAPRSLLGWVDIDRYPISGAT